MSTARNTLSMIGYLVLLANCSSPHEPLRVPCPPISPAPTEMAKLDTNLASTASPQQFADALVEPTFQDPDRRKKLAAAFPKIDEIIEEGRIRQDIPGISLGIIIDGELAYAQGYGLANLDTKVKPDADSVYRIASITKSFTAATILSLRDEGLLSIDDPLEKWIPEAKTLIYPTHESPRVTLLHLLQHTSGLPRESALGLSRSNSSTTEAELTKTLEKMQLGSDAGTTYSYSNFGFGLLGVIAGQAAHSSNRDAVKKRVLEPLGMTSTVWSREDVQGGHLATGYDKDPRGKFTAVAHETLGAMEGCGGLYSSVRDMARYVAFQLAAYPARNAPETSTIKRRSLREAHSNTVPLGVRVGLASAPNPSESLVQLTANHYGYGWLREQTCEFQPLVWHDGGLSGYRTYVGFLPSEGVGIVLLTNGGHASPGPLAERALLALQRSNGLSRRTSSVAAPMLQAATKRLFDVYQSWTDAGYRAMLPPGRDNLIVVEKAELEGYKKLHGSCKGFSPLRLDSALSGTFAWECERGKFEMAIQATENGLISSFYGISRDLPIPKEMQGFVDSVVGLVKKWDDKVFKKHLSKAARPREHAVALFDNLRALHRSCSAKAMSNVGFDKRIVLRCEYGGDLTLAFKSDAQAPDVLLTYEFESAAGGVCPVRSVD